MQGGGGEIQATVGGNSGERLESGDKKGGGPVNFVKQEVPFPGEERVENLFYKRGSRELNRGNEWGGNFRGRFELDATSGGEEEGGILGSLTKKETWGKRRQTQETGRGVGGKKGFGRLP